MQILQSITRLLRRPGVASSTAPMHRLSSAPRPPLSFMASAPPHWSPPALARRVFPLLVTPILADRRVSGFSHGSRNMASTSGLKGYKSGKPLKKNKSGKPNRRLHISSTDYQSSISQVMEKVVATSTTFQPQRSATKDVRRFLLSRDDDDDEDDPAGTLAKSRHRNGSIYMPTDQWKQSYNVHDRSETRLEAMMLSNPTDCFIENGICRRHRPRRMLQIFSLKLAGLLVDVGSAELYGYIAVRDGMDPTLNYVVNSSRDDPIIVEQGSLINMCGPKRGIDMHGSILFEYDLRIKTGEQEKDDLQLIDGISAMADLGGLWNCAFEKRICGDHGAVDLTVSRIDNAVEATVEVLISEVQRSFILCLRCFIGGFKEEIRLFDGAIGEPRGLQRSVLAPKKGSTMNLKFKVGAESSSSAEHRCWFKADTHGLSFRQIKTAFGLILVKVTWSTLIHGY